MKPYCIYTLGLILLACATLTACMEEEDAELQTQLVVEGWIEDGGYPVVLLGETHAIDAGMQNIENYIEIGAVKVNSKKEITDHFHRLIKPQVYKWIHDSIHEVIHVDYKDLMKGVPFEQAVREFIDWCGEDWYFFTWGNQDVMELQRNMKFYGLLDLLPGPVTYYDVQKLYSISYDDGTHRCALEHAIDELKIEKSRGFHRALADAWYTAKVLEKINNIIIINHPSLDVYQNPKKKKDEIHISYPDHDKYVSREFATRERIMKDREVTSTRCPVCHLPAKRKLRWFMNNPKVYYSISNCEEHGLIKGKIRIRKTEDEKYFAVKTLRFTDTEEAEELRERKEVLRLRRKLKRSVEKEI